MNKYAWKLKGLSKGLNPDDVVAELEKIQYQHGVLTPEIILEAARPKKALLHPLFEWDDSKAAYHYRLQQARTIINNIVVTTVVEGNERNIGVYEIITTKEGNFYKNIESLSESEIEFVRQSVFRELNYLKEKLLVYNQFNEVVAHISHAQELLK